ncbi:hypothetical protein [Devosia ginsengisoli]|uniref:Uncharacterized protein n=1 Tax=Devosia ginsengisoli TaxID=400770 RepID=A0A5B8LRG7_9HYPH|nr:hypothetical protein [Devosia ginsengisoli]QDZ10848.1 hypothetical protein FPZ08_08825 [Devosia ginsengisoli]
MIRTLVVAAFAIFVATPSFAAEVIGTHAGPPAVGAIAVADAAKPKPRRPAPKPDASDYLVLTLVDAS